MNKNLNTGRQEKSRAESTRQQQNTNIDRFIGELMSDLKTNRLELPTLPQVAIKINKTVKDRNSSAKDVAQIVATDPALSARLIQVSNSSLLSGHHKIDNVRTAVTRMGSNMVRNLVTSFLVKQLFRTRHKSLHTRMTTVWNHSAHVAAICHVLAREYSYLKADEVMLAGLIHDIGKLPILAKAVSVPSIAHNEKALDMVLDKLHPALGKAILTTWRFAPALITAVAEHEKITRDSSVLDHTDIVIVANLHSHLGKPSAKKVDWNEVAAMKKLKLQPEQSIEVLEQAHDEIVAIRNLLTT